MVGGIGSFFAANQKEIAMKRFTVSDLMVPLSEYATVPDDATLFEAVMALEEAQENVDFTRTKYCHRAVLVLNKDGQVVGKISQIGALRALEPKYDEILEGKGISGTGFTKKFLKSMVKDSYLFDRPLDRICEKAAERPVMSFASKPTEGEIIQLDATLDEAVHQLVIGSHQSLLVKKGEVIVGILRLSDVFAAVFHMMKECNLPDRRR
jgi:CBS domain-containing protein